MWVFKSKIRNSFLAANPKVLTQTLLHQKTLERYLSKKRLVHFIVKEIHRSVGPEYVMIVRNPYKRVESFFKEKLRQKVALVLNKNNPYKLKRHQTIFYEYLKIDPSDSLENQVKSLMCLDFRSFVKLIPELYKKEDHLAPQTYNFSRSLFGIYRTMKMNKYIRIESIDELDWLASYFSLDLSVRNNDSSDVKDNIQWDNESIAIVQQVYQSDFNTFKYDLNYPGAFLKRKGTINSTKSH